jgi:8-oxo-dGTP diphosphatase
MEIGHSYIGVSAGAVITDHDGRYFLAHRSGGARDDQGKWEFPGGSVKLFETREQAAVRNIRDKYALIIEISSVLGVYDVIDQAAGDHWLSTTFLCRWVSGEASILIPESCDDIGWFRIDELRTLELSRISRLNLRDLTAIKQETNV